MKENNYSIRYSLAEFRSSYCHSHSMSINGKTLKFTLEEAREIAKDKLSKRCKEKAIAEGERTYIKSVKIYNGREFIEEIS